MITLVVARALNGAIGKDGDIPWNAPEDLAMFQRETTGGALIMGRNTWVSLPVKPLPRRMNCVISRDRTLTDLVFGDIAGAVAACYAAGYTRVYGIGGEAIYAEMLPITQRILLTEVDLEVPDADAFFPVLNEAEWTETRRARLRESGPGCVLRELIRRV
jgi:dihydrofolate reductase